MLLSVAYGAAAQQVKIELNANKTIKHVVFDNKGCDTLRFHSERFDGPALLLGNERLPMRSTAENRMEGEAHGLKYSISYTTQDDKLFIDVECTNLTKSIISDKRLTLNMGVNSTMSHYPQWHSAYFPTLIRVEPTQMWGYLMSPSGGIITISSADAVAGYELYYNNKAEKRSFDHGHRIPSFAINLINPGRLPERFDNDRVKSLQASEKRTWRIALGATTDLQSVIPTVAQQIKAPIVTASLYTVDRGSDVELTIYSAFRPELEIKTPAGKSSKLKVQEVAKGQYVATYSDTKDYGLYSITATANKRQSTASVNVRRPWSEYAKSARRTALKYQQKGGSHTESWYGLFPAYRAAELFPEPEIDAQIEAKFDELYPLMHDKVTNLPTTYRTRIQNSALMAALLAQKYRAHRNIGDLRRAANILDFLMTQQSGDGAYRNGKVHYTSVIYIAKAFMEVMAIEKELASDSDEWRSNYNRHFHSAKLAVDELTRNLDNIDTEGELTYEDGMISCSYSQISMFALLMPEGSAERARYIEAAETIARGHRTLSQLLVPDARMNGASLRYWEAQYDILTFPNMMNSPHGWSAWRIYGLQYLYRLTGKEIYLRDMINSMGTCTQLLDPSNDKLNWAFVADPYIEAEVFVEDTANPGKGRYESRTIGEQYMPMISDWYRAPKDTWVSGYWKYDGGCCDNDVNEIFKCMGEVALTSAYVHRGEDGALLLWNCSAKQNGDLLEVTPNEDCVQTIYTNTDVNSNVKNIVRVGKK